MREKGGAWNSQPASCAYTISLLSPLRIPIGVDGRETAPFLGQIFERKDGGHWTHRNACAAIDAFRGMDVKLRFRGEFRLILARMNAVHRADIHAGGVFCADAGLGDHVSHSRSPLSNDRPGLCEIGATGKKVLISWGRWQQQAAK